MDVRIETGNGRIRLTCPYNADMPAEARKIGGRFDRASKSWTFDDRDEERVRELAVRFYGTDGSEPEGDLVTVRVKLMSCERSHYENFATFAGRRIAERPRRDADVRLAHNVVVVEGRLSGRGGSVKYPEIEAESDVVVEIRDLPRSALKAADVDYEIVGEDGPDVATLLAERERLVARIAEIDAMPCVQAVRPG